MKVLILGDVNSVHIRKWCIGLAGQGISIGIFSLSKIECNWFEGIENIEICGHAAIKDRSTFRKKAFSKMQYLKVVPALKKAIKAFMPDIVHAHYASSYGLLGALSGFHPFYISVWGNDVFEFPNQNKVQELTFKANLKCADRIFSTSHIMARETAKYTSKDVTVIPFGVSTGSFEGVKPTSLFANDTVVIGTIKTLEKDYAIDVLIKAFAIALASNPDVNLKLLICGKGTMEEALKDLTRELQIEEHVLFTGYIGHDEVPGYLAGMDIFCCFSNAESFGVAVVEAMAAGKPTAVSNAGGLPEVVDHGECGLIVETQDPEAAASAISKLIGDGNLRTYLGAKAKERVTREYDWNNCVKSMVSIYNSNKAG